MELSIIFGFACAIIIGTSLGLIGGGGSILTLPVLAYLFHIDAVLGTAYSLFVVGITSLVGAINFHRKQLIDYRTALVFAVPSLIAVYSTRRYIVPAIPEQLGSLAGIDLSRDLLIMLLFAVVMLIAAFSMIRKKKTTADAKKSASTARKFNYPVIMLEGLLVGLVTGLVGAGGGFLIIPALVLLAGLPMKKAIGTSLLIIAAKSLIGFLGDVGNPNIDWSFLLAFSGLSIVGILLGTWLSKFIPGAKLKTAFGWFVLVMGVFIITKELVL